MMAARLGPADGVLVTGDIAFSGRPNEYEAIAPWLQQVLDMSCGDDAKVLMVPGNHDVDRTKADDNWNLRVLQDRLNSCPDTSLDKEFEDALNHEPSGLAL